MRRKGLETEESGPDPLESPAIAPPAPTPIDRDTSPKPPNPRTPDASGTNAAGPLDLAKIAALVAAVDALLSASLTEQARPLVRELRAHVEAAQGPRAAVLDLRAERSKRRDA